MSVVAMIGAQWGDEGKGKIADVLSRECAATVRFNGGRGDRRPVGPGGGYRRADPSTGLNPHNRPHG